MKSCLFALCFGLLFLSSCGNKPAAGGDQTGAPPTTPTPSPATNTGIKETVAVLEELNDDAPFPMAYLAVREAGAEDLLFLNFMQEGFPVSMDKIRPLVGKKVKVSYEAIMGEDIIDMHINGRSLFDSEQPPMAHWKKCEGILNAPAITEGDLPDDLSIKMADGTVKTFDLYIDDQMVAAHGKSVVA